MDPTREGREYESEMARELGLDMQPGSGSTPWAKLDLGEAGSLLLSLKWTGAASFPLHPKLFEEIDQAVMAPGGVGDDVLGGLLVRVGGRDLLCMDLVSLTKLLKEKRRLGVQSKAEARRERARTPALFRDEDGEA